MLGTYKSAWCYWVQQGTRPRDALLSLSLCSSGEDIDDEGECPQVMQIIKMQSCGTECPEKASMRRGHLSRNGNDKGSGCKGA